ncbi:MAG: hypothetical protein HOP29_00610 [Phycisphaerales bacterium]|nr:hypothetical protein [Phycisphaerales bacterium]
MSLINGLMTGAIDLMFAPFERGSGWLSLVLAAGVLALMGLLVYRYTSNQAAIRRTKARIKAELLAIRLFRDEPGVIVGAMLTTLTGSAALLRYALAPLAVMVVPFALILAQLAMRYQWRPVRVDEAVLVTAGVDSDVDLMKNPPRIESGETVVIDEPPVRIPAERRVVWRVRAKAAGIHEINVLVGGRGVPKTLTVGDGFQAVSPKRVQAGLWHRVMYPAEGAIPADAAVKWISIDYAPRESWFCGATVWVLWLIGISYVWALVLKRWMGVEF